LRTSDENAAALARSILFCVGSDVVQHPLDDGDHSASTAIAIPMPPPMQSEATP